MPGADNVKQSMGAWYVQNGDHALNQGQLDKAADFYRQALAVAQDANTRRYVLVGLASSTLRLGDFEHASDYYEQALQVAPRAAMPDVLATANEAALLMELGKGYYRRGDIDRALRSIEMAAAYAGDLRDVDGTPGTRLAHLAHAYLGVMGAASPIEPADEYSRDALSYAKENRDDLIAGASLIGLSLAEILAGRPAPGIDLLQQALPKLRAVHEPMLEAEVGAILCLAYVETDQPDAALDMARQIPERGSGIVSRRARCVALTATGLAQALMGQFHAALASGSEALAVCQEIASAGDFIGVRMEARALLGLGMANDGLGHSDEALSAYREVLTRAHESHETSLRLRAMLGIGAALLPSSATEARAAYELALTTAKESGSGAASASSEALAQAGLAQAEAARGRASEASALLQSALTTAESAGDTSTQARIHLSASAMYRTLGKSGEAFKHAQRALEVVRAHHMAGLEAQALTSMGIVLAEAGDAGKAGQAVQLLSEALEQAEAAGHRQQQLILGGLGAAYATLGDVPKAVEVYAQAQKLAHEAGDRRAEAQWLAHLGSLYAYIGQSRRAVEPYQQAIFFSQELGDQRTQANLLVALGLVYSDLDVLRDAVVALKEARALFAALGDDTSRAQVDDLLRQIE